MNGSKPFWLVTPLPKNLCLVLAPCLDVYVLLAFPPKRQFLSNLEAQRSKIINHFKTQRLEKNKKLSFILDLKNPFLYFLPH